VGNKKVFRVHLQKDVSEILIILKRKLSRFCVILNDHLTFVEQVTLEHVGMVPLMNFARLSVGREGYGRSLVVRSALVAPGTGVASFGMCHCF
jgi:hypothetical protein